MIVFNLRKTVRLLARMQFSSKRCFRHKREINDIHVSRIHNMYMFSKNSVKPPLIVIFKKVGFFQKLCFQFNVPKVDIFECTYIKFFVRKIRNQAVGLTRVFAGKSRKT